MKLYTTPEQTAKLIVLGFEKPKSISSIKVTGDIITTAEDLIGEPSSVMGGKINANYSIGELMEMLPAKIDGTYCNIDRCGQRSWAISYDLMVYCCNCAELVDALYNMILTLKEEGVI